MARKILSASLCAVLTLIGASAAADGLQVTHGDPLWNGEVVPERGICTRRGGEGWSPEIVVTGLPAGTAALELRFTDKDWNEEGAHGIIRTDVPENAEGLTLASFKGEADALPDGMTAVASHKCGKCGGGVYLGPCSGGKAHDYVVNVYALDADGAELSSGTLPLGNY